MKRVLQALAVVAITAFALTASAQNLDIPAEVHELLGGIEYVPTAAEWQKLGPDAAVTLKAIAGSPKERPSKRSRAISALAHFPTADTKAFLTGLAADTNLKGKFRGKALRALAHGFKADSVSVLTTYAADTNATVREDAVLGLGHVATPEAKDVLKKRLELETKVHLRETIQKSLAQ
jgi:HEAT repeat protein